MLDFANETNDILKSPMDISNRSFIISFPIPFSYLPWHWPANNIHHKKWGRKYQTVAASVTRPHIWPLMVVAPICKS